MRRTFCINFDSMRMYNNMVLFCSKVHGGRRFLKVGIAAGVEEKKEIH